MRTAAFFSGGGLYPLLCAVPVAILSFMLRIGTASLPRWQARIQVTTRPWLRYRLILATWTKTSTAIPRNLGMDGVNVWPFLLNPGSNNSAAHRYLVLSKEVVVAGDYKLIVAQPNFKTQNNGWRYHNGSWLPSDDSQWPCNAQDGPLTQIFPGVPGKRPCLFNVATDRREMTDLATEMPDMVRELWIQLNQTVLTTYLHGVSGPAGNPGGIARCSPSALLGNCNATSAAAYFKRWGQQSLVSLCTMTVFKGIALRESIFARKGQHRQRNYLLCSVSGTKHTAINLVFVLFFFSFFFSDS